MRTSAQTYGPIDKPSIAWQSEVTAVLQWLDALTVESPVAMLSELARVSHYTSELTAIAVRHTR